MNVADVKGEEIPEQQVTLNNKPEPVEHLFGYLKKCSQEDQRMVVNDAWWGHLKQFGRFPFLNRLLLVPLNVCVDVIYDSSLKESLDGFGFQQNDFWEKFYVKNS